MTVPKVEERESIRVAARAYEEALPAARRKELGQFFTGVPLGKLLAHLAIGPSTTTVLDPMAGHGDLLDAVFEAADERGIPLERLDAVEIDASAADVCSNRLARICAGQDLPTFRVIGGDAFDPATHEALGRCAYDLVITNPPYVRYQTLNGRGERTRSGLTQIVERYSSSDEWPVWKALAAGYSGLADLSIPAWILAGLLVRPGGRLALVVPATWRSRDYADVIRYMLLRCFRLEVVVEDTQPGWFTDALVRAHLIVARRLSPEELSIPLNCRASWPSAAWARVAPTAADRTSLVGASYKDACPEAAFAAWLRNPDPAPKPGLELRRFSLADEWSALRSRAQRQAWFHQLESGHADLPLFARDKSTVWIPEAVSSILPASIRLHCLSTLEDAGIRVGQGLRTGCNRFFYVTVTGATLDDTVHITTAATFGLGEFAVPAGVLRPVLHRQADISVLQSGSIPPTRVLDLRGWILPEDRDTVLAADAVYLLCGEQPPRIMPESLAQFVRKAATLPLGQEGSGKPVPELSAVRTNVRPARNGMPPRFWYMLPDFMPRHLPAAFTPRINNGSPWVEANLEPPILIDANFSTFWTTEPGWTRFGLKALLNSAWCRALMEALGTQLGGGALKLEATHLKQMPVPRLNRVHLKRLDAAGRALSNDNSSVQTIIDRIVLQAILPSGTTETAITSLAVELKRQADAMRCTRLRAVS